MTRSHSKTWRLNRQINLAVIVQLALLLPRALFIEHFHIAA